MSNASLTGKFYICAQLAKGRIYLPTPFQAHKCSLLPWSVFDHCSPHPGCLDQVFSNLIMWEIMQAPRSQFRSGVRSQVFPSNEFQIRLIPLAHVAYIRSRALSSHKNLTMHCRASFFWSVFLVARWLPFPIILASSEAAHPKVQE